MGSRKLADKSGVHSEQEQVHIRSSREHRVFEIYSGLSNYEDISSSDEGKPDSKRVKKTSKDEGSVSKELGTLDWENDIIPSSCDPSTPVLQGSTDLETSLQDYEVQLVQLQQYRYFGSGGNSGPSVVDFLPFRS